MGLGLSLAACQEGANPFKSAPKGETAEGAEAPAPASSARIVERDVEAPEVFSVEEAGLWDGRPSLGGVWVAHPSVKDPERVIIRNPANGKFVIGALFRRERENPGPKLQISSDAAAALDILAGAPSKLSVVALRREESPVEPLVSAPEVATADPAKADPAKAAAGALGAEAIAATSLDAPAAGASAGAEAEAAPMTAKERRAARRAERAAAK
ncbi:MAG: SPOR domain-containing protein, partial [Sphingomonadales bacterium]|nr:SPOR domain-containing protein [Sphingomonadales bacterium]